MHLYLNFFPMLHHRTIQKGQFPFIERHHQREGLLSSTDINTSVGNPPPPCAIETVFPAIARLLVP